VGNPYRERPLGRSRTRWEDNIKTNLREKFVRMGDGWKWLKILSLGGDEPWGSFSLLVGCRPY
jgi:hypothetical protein